MCSQWLDIYITYEVTLLTNLVRSGSHTQLLQYDWLFSLCCTLHPCGCSVTTNWYFLIPSLDLFYPHPFPSGSHQNVLGTYETVPVWLFGFLDSTCKWNHMAFVLLCLTYFTQHNPLSRSIHVVADGKVSFFFWLSNIPLYMCTTSVSIHLLLGT